MVVLNSITVREHPALYISHSSTVKECWYSSAIHDPSTSTTLITGGYVLHVVLAMTSCYSYFVMKITIEKWLQPEKCNL